MKFPSLLKCWPQPQGGVGVKKIIEFSGQFMVDGYVPLCRYIYALLHSLSISLSLPHSLSPPLSLSLNPPLSLSLSLPLSLSHSLPPPHSLSLSHSLSLCLSLAHPCFITVLVLIPGDWNCSIRHTWHHILVSTCFTETLFCFFFKTFGDGSFSSTSASLQQYTAITIYSKLSMS